MFFREYGRGFFQAVHPSVLQICQCFLVGLRHIICWFRVPTGAIRRRREQLRTLAAAAPAVNLLPYHQTVTPEQITGRGPLYKLRDRTHTHLRIKQGKKVCKTTGFRSLSFSSENKVNIHIKNLRNSVRKFFPQKSLPLRVPPSKIILSPRIANTKIC